MALPVLARASTSLALFLVFARIGAATFGGGFAMIPPIEHEVVAVRGWLSEAAFHDAVVLGRVTAGAVTPRRRGLFLTRTLRRSGSPRALGPRAYRCEQDARFRVRRAAPLHFKSGAR
jgi:hypothetical protein